MILVRDGYMTKPNQTLSRGKEMDYRVQELGMTGIGQAQFIKCNSPGKSLIGIADLDGGKMKI